MTQRIGLLLTFSAEEDLQVNQETTAEDLLCCLKRSARHRGLEAFLADTILWQTATVTIPQELIEDAEKQEDPSAALEDLRHNADLTAVHQMSIESAQKILVNKKTVVGMMNLFSVLLGQVAAPASEADDLPGTETESGVKLDS